MRSKFNSSRPMHTRTLPTAAGCFLLLRAFPFSPLIRWVRVQRNRARPWSASAHRRRTRWLSASPSSVTRWVSTTFPFPISTSLAKIADLNSNSGVLWIRAEQSAVHTELHGGRWCSQAPPHRPLLARCGRRARCVCVYYSIVFV